MRIAIHQPNLCPWLPFWEKMRDCDVFVLLTRAQFRKGGFENRFSHEGKWHTMSVEKGLDPLIEKKYVSPKEDWQRILNEFPQFNFLSEHISESLFHTNIGIITEIRTFLDIETKLEIDFPTKKKATDRLIEICQHFGANEYLSGESGGKYLDLEKFKKAGIKIEFQHKKSIASLADMI